MITSFDFASGKWLPGAADRLPAHDLYFGTPMNRPTAGIPIGDGDTGSLIWQERDGIHINIGKSDLWKDAAPEKAKKNMQMKECGKAHLGSPALMLREDGYYFEE